MNCTLKLMTLGMGVGAALTLTAAAEDPAAAPPAAPAAPAAVHAETGDGHVHATAPGAKAGPRIQSLMAPGPDGMPPAFLQMQELQGTIKAKEKALTDKDPSIKEQLKSVDAEIRAFQAEYRARQAALMTKKREVYAAKDPELKALYEKLSALREQVRSSTQPMNNMRRMPGAVTPPAAPPVPAAAK